VEDKLLNANGPTNKTERHDVVNTTLYSVEEEDKLCCLYVRLCKKGDSKVLQGQDTHRSLDYLGVKTQEMLDKNCK